MKRITEDLKYNKSLNTEKFVSVFPCHTCLRCYTSMGDVWLESSCQGHFEQMMFKQVVVGNGSTAFPV